MSIAPIFTACAFASSTVALLLDGFRWDWNVLVSALSGGVFALILWGLNKIWESRTRHSAREEKRVASVLDDASDERQVLLDEYARLRREEREHTERLCAGYSRIAETARKRSHLMAQGFMQYQLAHQGLCEIMRNNSLAVPETMVLKDATANLLVKLDAIADAELPVD